MALYTPFMEKVGATLGASMARTGRSELAGSAYMGDSNAMQELMRVDPNLGIQIQEKQRTQKQNKLNDQNKAQGIEQKKALEQRKIYTENRDLMDGIFKEATKIGDFDQAKEYVQRRFNEARDILGSHADASGFTPEVYDQMKQVFGEKKDETVDKVHQSKILPGGLVQIVRDSGKVDTITQEQENVEKIKEAEKYGAELEGLRAGERGAATSAQKKSVDSFKKMTSVRKTISLLDEGIRLLDVEGADTGPIESMFPSIKAASIELDNIQANLGLNVIQNTTFGSLSDAELKFALNSTMPKNLDAPKLSEWMKKKRSAQDKLAKYLEETAIYLGTPGNNIADFLRRKKTKQFVSEDQITENKAESGVNIQSLVDKYAN